MTEPSASPPDYDRLAVLLSGLCLVHCLALPLAIAALPLFAGLGDGHWHLPMLAVALPVSVAAIVMGYRRHGNRRVVAAVAAGLALLVLGATLGHSVYGVVVDRSLTVAGSLLLAAAHWQNGRLVREARCGPTLARG